MDKLEYWLKVLFNREAFRPGQREVVEAVLAGRDVLALWPTGAGKSLTYQLPALLLPGLTLVISPLIALMEDQVEQLRRRSANWAHYLNSSQSTDLRHDIIQELHNKKEKMLFLAPERLLNYYFLEQLRHIPISLMAVDEAHCITQWGNDFRHSYMRIGEAVRVLKPRSILAVTATADSQTAQQICRSLGMCNPLLSRLSLDRPNLEYAAVKAPLKQRAELALQHLQKSAGLPAVIYASKRDHTESLAKFFQENGLKAAPYHAGLPAEERRRIQQAFLEDKLQLITATTAFGMGVDKPNIRQVIHITPPNSPEGYYQEAGRAGRDRNKGHCLLFWGSEDFNWLKNQGQSRYACARDIRKFYSLLPRHPARDLRLEFIHLSQTAWDTLTDTALGYEADLDDIAEPILEESCLINYFERLQSRAEQRLEAMENYCRTRECRRRALLSYFDQEAPAHCGACDNCLNRISRQLGLHLQAIA